MYLAVIGAIASLLGCATATGLKTVSRYTVQETSVCVEATAVGIGIGQQSLASATAGSPHKMSSRQERCQRNTVHIKEKPE